jgi:hypothetical protein
MIQASRRRALPPVLQMAYRLRRRSDSPWPVILLGVGLLCTLLFGWALLTLRQSRPSDDWLGLMVATAVSLLVTVAAGFLLCRRWWTRRARA